uniref:XPG-I domain-containing protein n=1 Tax=viral metagenome TaxID=1070528 RepID=A0A6C0JVS5_9ZZZZ
MGIKNNFDIFKGCDKEINLKFLSGKRIVIDMMTYIIRSYKCRNNILEWYSDILSFLNVLKGNDVTVICVFDGKNKPPEKKDCIKKRKDVEKKKYETNEYFLFPNKNTEWNEYRWKRLDHGHNRRISNITKNIESDILAGARVGINPDLCIKFSSYPRNKEIDNLMILITEKLNIRCLIADGEAESLCCYLYKNNEADFVVSDDSDILLYDIDKFIMKFDGNKGKLYYLDEILTKHLLTFEEIFLLALIMGTDYNQNIDTISFKNGYMKIKNEGIEKITKDLETSGTNYERLKFLFTPNSLYTTLKYDNERTKEAFDEIKDIHHFVK